MRTKHQVMTVNCPMELRKKLGEISKKERRSLSAQAVLFLMDAVLRYNTANKKEWVHEIIK
jgi:hypothetical protein